MHGLTARTGEQPGVGLTSVRGSVDDFIGLLRKINEPFFAPFGCVESRVPQFLPPTAPCRSYDESPPGVVNVPYPERKTSPKRSPVLARTKAGPYIVDI
jgi:hypothetical protein